MGGQERESTDKPRTDDQPRSVPRKPVEDPRAWYKRFTARPDVRRLLEKLAKL
jgi:hypothetical protein